MMQPATRAAGNAMWRYAIRMSGCTPRIADAISVPTMPTSKLTENVSSVPMKVSNSERTGTPYQRGEMRYR